jgi:hypothetical protein
MSFEEKNNEKFHEEMQAIMNESSIAWRMNKYRRVRISRRWKYCCIIEGCNAPPRNSHRSVYSKSDNPLSKYEPGLCSKHYKLEKDASP